MYYEDLSTYVYGFTNPDALNIGWLEKGYSFPTGNFPEKEKVLKKLKSMKRQNLYRGWHGCDFCDHEITKNGTTTLVHDRNGNGEYIIEGNNKTYSAPALITHYIESHNYKPPQEFIDAIISLK